MALVKYGGGIVQASGSIAGNTFARNRFGNYMRARTKPVNPQSARQVAARNRISFLSEEWSDTLTAAQRLAWGAYAAAVAWTNKLGESINLTGFNMFCRSNAAMLSAGGAVVAAGPTTLSLPNTDPMFSVALSAANGITVTFDDSLDWCDEDDGFMTIDLGTPQLASRNFFGGPWRFAQAIAGDSASPPSSPDGPTATTTWTLIAGQLVWARARIIRSDGRITNTFGSAAVTVGA